MDEREHVYNKLKSINESSGANGAWAKYGITGDPLARVGFDILYLMAPQLMAEVWPADFTGYDSAQSKVLADRVCCVCKQVKGSQLLHDFKIMADERGVCHIRCYCKPTVGVDSACEHGDAWNHKLQMQAPSFRSLIGLGSEQNQAKGITAMEAVQKSKQLPIYEKLLFLTGRLSGSPIADHDGVMLVFATPKYALPPAVDVRVSVHQAVNYFVAAAKRAVYSGAAKRAPGNLDTVFEVAEETFETKGECNKLGLPLEPGVVAALDGAQKIGSMPLSSNPLGFLPDESAEKPGSLAEALKRAEL
jgi:hypothetical protein